MINLHFILNASGTPASKLADVEVIFKDGPLSGLKLVGTSVWKSKRDEGQVNVLVPSRSYATSSGVRYYELLRSQNDENKENIEAFKERVKKEYLAITKNETGRDN
jgi:hypothetical protein